MIHNVLFIFVSFGCISASKIKIKEDKFHGRKHISEDIAGNFEDFKNFFILIRKDPDACNKYAPNQPRCKRVFVNIEALTKNPKWMKIDLQTIMPELGQAHDMFFTNFLKMNLQIFCTEYYVVSICFDFLKCSKLREKCLILTNKKFVFFFNSEVLVKKFVDSYLGN